MSTELDYKENNKESSEVSEEETKPENEVESGSESDEIKEDSDSDINNTEAEETTTCKNIHEEIIRLEKSLYEIQEAIIILRKIRNCKYDVEDSFDTIAIKFLEEKEIELSEELGAYYSQFVTLKTTNKN